MHGKAVVEATCKYVQNKYIDTGKVKRQLIRKQNIPLYRLLVFNTTRLHSTYIPESDHI